MVWFKWVSWLHRTNKRGNILTCKSQRGSFNSAKLQLKWGKWRRRWLIHSWNWPWWNSFWDSRITSCLTLVWSFLGIELLRKMRSKNFWIITPLKWRRMRINILLHNCQSGGRIQQRTIQWLNSSATRISKRSWAWSRRRLSATWWAQQNRKILMRSESSRCPSSASIIIFFRISVNAIFLRFQSCGSLPRPTSANSRTFFKVRVKWRSCAAFTRFWHFFGSPMTILLTLTLIWTNLCL